MEIEVDRERIVNKFKRNNLFLNKPSLEMVTDHLRSINNPHKRLDEIIKKMNEMVIMDQQQMSEGTLKLAIDLLTHKTQTGKSFRSFDSFLEYLKKWTIFYISPYESSERFFVDKPDPSLFQFVPEDYLQMNQNRFKSIRQYNSAKLKNTKGYTFIGVLFEKFSGEKSKIMLQNQINEVQLIFPPNYNLECFLIPGCTYIAEGDFKNKDLQLTLASLSLPLPIPPIKHNLFQAKLKHICETMSLSKSTLDFTPQDLKAYQVIYNKTENKVKPILIFGNVKINAVEISKIKRVVEEHNKLNGIECLILMISQGQHEEMDLKKQFGESISSIFIVPHINSEGPRILPKPPILKHFYNAKVVTNPARFSILGKQCLLLNYPIVKNLYSKSLIPKQIMNVDQTEMAKKVLNFLSSQNNIAVTNKIFWKQSQYFNISSQDLIIICDKACPQVNYSEDKGGLISIGNFQLDGDFVCFMPNYKDPIHLSRMQ